MKITVFTSNQPRHLALLRSLSRIADTVYAIQEGTTVFPGEVKDRYDNSDVMRIYFSRVRAAETDVFGTVEFLPENVRQLALRAGDLTHMPISALSEALESDVYIVFGSSFIKGELIRFLVEHKAINLHMGVSPYFRGASCNFWAVYDGHPELVGATIHLLSEKLDAGEILYHAMPAAKEVDGFVLGMEAVKAAHESLVARIADGSLFTMVGEIQDSSKELRYSRNIEFNDAVAEDYLRNMISPTEIKRQIENRDLSLLKDPYILKEI